jgi:hypothetical protein
MGCTFCHIGRCITLISLTRAGAHLVGGDFITLLCHFLERAFGVYADSFGCEDGVQFATALTWPCVALVAMGLTLQCQKLHQAVHPLLEPVKAGVLPVF